MIFDTIRGWNIEESEMYGVRIGVNPASPHWGIRRFAAPSTTLLPHHPCLPVHLWLYLHPCIHICHLDFINNSFFFNSPLLHIYPASCPPLRPFLSSSPLPSLCPRRSQRSRSTTASEQQGLCQAINTHTLPSQWWCQRLFCSFMPQKNYIGIFYKACK